MNNIQYPYYIKELPYIWKIANKLLKKHYF